MLDALIQFLLEEIAMDGEQGTELSRLDSFLLDYSTTSNHVQHLDPNFNAFIWTTLLNQSSISVALLQPQPTTSTATVHTFKLTPITTDQLGLHRQDLVNLYGDQLRVLVNQDEAWQAITGSHEHPTLLTPVVYELLQLVTRARGQGCTVIEIGKTLGIDQKSAFHYVASIVTLGIVKKFRTVEFGAWTNRILHVRYLSTSPHWAAFTASDSDPLPLAAPPSDASEDEEEYSFFASNGRLPKIGRNYLVENIELVKGRILRALRKKEGCWMPHGEVVSAIGMYGTDHRDLRTLNGMINSMVDSGHLVKLRVERPSASILGRTVFVAYVKLSEREILGQGDALAVQGLEELEQEEVGPQAMFATLPLDRQIVDIIASFGVTGVRNHEIAQQLSAISTRTIDNSLQKLLRDNSLPSSLIDQEIFSVMESFGREKYIRWFTIENYLTRCRQDGAHVVEVESKLKRGIDGDGAAGRRIGGWTEGDAGGYFKVEQDVGEIGVRRWGDPRLGDWTKKIKKKPIETKKPSKKRATSSLPKPPLPKPSNAPSSVSTASSSEEEPAGPPRGNTPPSQLTYYERAKRAAAERVRLGLPPKPKRPSDLGGRRSKAFLEEQRIALLEKEKERMERGGISEVEIVPQGKKGKGKLGTRKGTRVRGTAPPPTPLPKLEARSALDLESTHEVIVSTTSKDELVQSSATKNRRRPANSVEERPPPPSPSPITAPSSKATLVIPATPSTAAPKRRGRARKTLEIVLPIDEMPTAQKEATLVLGRGVPSSTTSTPVTRTSARLSKTVDRPPLPSSIVPPTPSSSGLKRAGRPSQNRPPVGLQVEGKVETATAVASQGAKGAKGKGRKRTRLEAQLGEREIGGNETVVTGRSEDGVETAVAQATPPITNPPSATLEPPSSPSRPNKKARFSTLSSSRTAINLSSFARQNEILSYVNAESGIIDASYKFAQRVLEHTASQALGKKGFLMDRVVLGKEIDTLVDRGLLRRTSTIVSAGAGEGRRDLLYLPETLLDSEQMKNFVKNLRTTTSYNHNPSIATIRIDPAKLSPGLEPRLKSPGPSDDLSIVREYFVRQSRILGARYGVYYGRFARARSLSEFLVGIFEGELAKEEKYAVQGIEGEPRVLLGMAIYGAIPLGVWLKIVPLPLDSEEFEKFIQEGRNLELRMDQLPKGIRRLVQPTHSKRKKSMLIVLRCLIELRILEPLELRSTAASGRRKETFRPTKAEKASYWLLNKSAPIYTYGDFKGPRLVQVRDIDRLEGMKEYWEVLYQHSARYTTDLEVQSTVSSTSFAPLNESPLAHRKLIISTTKWFNSYMLLLEQRRYLAKLLKRENPVDPKNFSAGELEIISATVLAPKEVVELYLLMTEEKLKRKKEGILSGKIKAASSIRKRARQGREVQVELGAEAEEDDITPDKTYAQVQQSLASKASATTDQQLKDWTAITNRFISDHPTATLSTTVLDYLKSRFCASKQGITSIALQSELLLLLGDPAFPVDLAYTTIVPVNMDRKASGPYVLPGRATRGPKSTLPRPRGSGAVSAAGRAGGSQDQFLSTPARAVPTLLPSQRMPRNFLTAEQEDLLLDATAIIRARANFLRVRLFYSPLEQLFGNLDSTKLRLYFLHLVKNLAEKAYHDRLVLAWTEFWERKKRTGEQGLPEDPEPGSLLDFDLAKFVHCLRSNIDKQELRLAGPAPINPDEPVVSLLPSSLDLLNKQYILPPTGSDGGLEVIKCERFDFYWKASAGTKSRIKSVTAVAFSDVCEGSTAIGRGGEGENACERRRDHLVRGGLKMTAITEKEIYNSDDGFDFLKAHQPMLVESTARMIREGVMRLPSKDEARVQPGRNFMIGTKYTMALEETLALECHALARKTTIIILQSDRAERVSNVIEDGEMLAMIQAFSNDQITLLMNEETEQYIARMEHKNVSRKTIDSVNEFPVFVSRNSQPKAFLNPSAIVNPFEGTGDQDRADTGGSDGVGEIVELGKAEIDIGRGAVERVVHASGAAGMSVEQIIRELESLPRRAVLQEIRSLLPSPSIRVSDRISMDVRTLPRLYFVGITVPTLVSRAFISEWTLLLHSSPSIGSLGHRVFPLVWRNIQGTLVEEYRARSEGWLLGILGHSPGLNLAQLFARSQSAAASYSTAREDVGALLSLQEVMLLVEQLHRRRQLVGRWGPSSVGSVEGEWPGSTIIDDVVVQWDQVVWYRREGEWLK